jgi:hypothetical protein
MLPEELNAHDEAALRRVYADLRALADHPVPAVRGPVRLALGEVAQVLNSLGLSYELYSTELTP